VVLGVDVAVRLFLYQAYFLATSRVDRVADSVLGEHTASRFAGHMLQIELLIAALFVKAVEKTCSEFLLCVAALKPF
jgi:hypothetical protein